MDVSLEEDSSLCQVCVRQRERTQILHNNVITQNIEPIEQAPGQDVLVTGSDTFAQKFVLCVCNVLYTAASTRAGRMYQHSVLSLVHVCEYKCRPPKSGQVYYGNSCNIYRL